MVGSPVGLTRPGREAVGARVTVDRAVWLSEPAPSSSATISWSASVKSPSEGTPANVVAAPPSRWAGELAVYSIGDCAVGLLGCGGGPHLGFCQFSAGGTVVAGVRPGQDTHEPGDDHQSGDGGQDRSKPDKTSAGEIAAGGPVGVLVALGLRHDCRMRRAQRPRRRRAHRERGEPALRCGHGTAAKTSSRARRSLSDATRATSSGVASPSR